ncbi:hypothetical protein ES703_83399 [subsurface metagenome]
MAKLNAPLFSFRASGKLANALVYFGWKGLNVVRSYVVPSNPQTAAQVEHRDYMTAAVAMVHTAQARPTNPLDQEDQTAMSALGSLRRTPRTWFNEICKLWIDCKVAGKKPIVYSNWHITGATRATVTGIGFLNEETPSSLDAGKFYLGLSKTNLVHAYVAQVAAGASITLPETDMEAWMKVGDKVYIQFRPDSGVDCDGADSGIYYFTAE